MTEPPIQTGVDHVHPHPHKTGHRWVDLVIAVSAISISVISLFVAIEHGEIERKLVAANSWPFIVFYSTMSGLVPGSRVVTLNLRNSGVGPARVQWVRVMLDGKLVRSHGELMAACCGLTRADSGQEIADGLYSQNPMVGVLPPRESVDVLTWRETPGHEALWAGLNAARHRLTLTACYCSVLDECWKTDLKSTTSPTPVKSCPIPVDGYTE